jgi:hypothetical protein
MAEVDPPGSVESALGGYGEATRGVVVPLLLYKSAFLGEWFEALVRRERDPSVRGTLVKLSESTLREAIELLDTMRRWDPLTADAHALPETLQRQVIGDLVALKEGSNEAILHAAMRAPTDELRRALVRLADLDRVHADDLRALLATTSVRELTLRRRPESPLPAGAHEGRRPGVSLRASIQGTIRAIVDLGTSPARLTLSAAAYRHLRDEGEVRPEATAFGLPIDVDFGWSGECYAVVTGERVRLAELLTQER